MRLLLGMAMTQQDSERLRQKSLEERERESMHIGEECVEINILSFFLFNKKFEIDVTLNEKNGKPEL